MSKLVPTKTQKWLRDLSWLGGPESMAIVAIVLAVPYVVTRLIEISRNS